jgi:hypothetical protein
LQDEAGARLLIGHAQRLEQSGYRAMQTVAEGQSQGEFVSTPEVDFADQRDVAVHGGIEFIVELKVVGQLLPSVGRPGVAAGAAHEPAGHVQRQPGVVLVSSQDLTARGLDHIAVVVGPTALQVRG